ncbi:MAG: CPBP family intramembrane glutamic endopeptidase [Actinocatenispora sp.]
MTAQTLSMTVIIGIVVAFGGVAISHRMRTKRPIGFGIRHGGVKEFGIGLLLGAVAFLGIFAVEWSRGLVHVHRIAVDPRGLAQALGLVLLLAVAEEVAFRGLLMPGLLIVFHRRWVALLLSAALFAANHFFTDGMTRLTILSALLGGIMYGLAYLATGRIWLPLGLHIAWNFVQGPILGFPVSGSALDGSTVIRQTVTGPDWLQGGAYGPEGGMIGILFRLLVILTLLVLARTAFSRPRVPQYAPAR